MKILSIIIISFSILVSTYLFIKSILFYLKDKEIFNSILSIEHTKKLINLRINKISKNSKDKDKEYKILLNMCTTFDDCIELLNNLYYVKERKDVYNENI